MLTLNQLGGLDKLNSQIDSEGELTCDFGVYECAFPLRLARWLPGGKYKVLPYFKCCLKDGSKHSMEFGEVEGAVAQATANVRCFPGWLFFDTHLFLDR